MGTCAGSQCASRGGTLFGYPGLPVKEPTQEQRSKVNQLIQGTIQKHEGVVAIDRVARAKDPHHEIETYEVVTVAPSFWRTTHQMVMRCCPEDSVAPDEPRFSSYGADVFFDMSDTTLSDDPGPPQDPKPASSSFLGLPLPLPQISGSTQEGKPTQGSMSAYLWGSAKAGSKDAEPGADMKEPHAAGSALRAGDEDSSPSPSPPLSSAPPSPPAANSGIVAAVTVFGRTPDASRREPGSSDGRGGGTDRGIEGKSTAAPNDSKTSSPQEDPAEALARAASLARGFQERYTLGKRLNAGAQGVTYLAKAKFSGRQVVVKKPNDASDTSDFALLSTKTHPNIVRVFELFQDRLGTYVVMEYCAGGDLFQAVSQLKKPTQNWTAAIFRQVVWGVYHLHDFFDESHNDIKPENIFLDRPATDSTDVPRAMIGDFGCLARIGQSRSGGDPRYRAPETFEVPTFGRATDIWALGVTLYEIASGGLLVYLDVPNSSSWDKFRKSGKWETMQRHLLRGLPPSFEKLGTGSEHELDQLKDLLRGLLNVKPNRRMSLARALEQPWLKLNAKGEAVQFDPTTSSRLSRRAQHHVLDMALLNLVGSVLQGASVKHYQAIWSKYDKNADGTMNLEEFELMLVDLGLVDFRRSGSADAGRDGGSDDPEASSGLVSPSSKRASTVFSAARNRAFQADPHLAKPTAAELFALADGNASGAVEFNEFVGLMFNPDHLSDAERAEYFKAAFLTLSGDDGKISPDELAGLFADGGWSEAKERSQVISALFRDMDADGNGYIGYEEFAQYLDEL